jgi:hypothetical protein
LTLQRYEALLMRLRGLFENATKEFCSVIEIARRAFIDAARSIVACCSVILRDEGVKSA